jgi:hypothetical protein
MFCYLSTLISFFMWNRLDIFLACTRTGGYRFCCHRLWRPGNSLLLLRVGGGVWDSVKNRGDSARWSNRWRAGALLAAGGVGSDNTIVRHDGGVFAEATWELNSGSLVQRALIYALASDNSDLPKRHESNVFVGVILERFDGSNGFQFNDSALVADVTVGHGATGMSVHVVADLINRLANLGTGPFTGQRVDVHIDVTITAAGDFSNSVDRESDPFELEFQNSHTRVADAVATGTITVDYLPGVNFAAGPSTSGMVTISRANYRLVVPPPKEELLASRLVVESTAVLK